MILGNAIEREKFCFRARVNLHYKRVTCRHRNQPMLVMLKISHKIYFHKVLLLKLNSGIPYVRILNAVWWWWLCCRSSSPKLVRLGCCWPGELWSDLGPLTLFWDPDHYIEHPTLPHSRFFCLSWFRLTFKTLFISLAFYATFTVLSNVYIYRIWFLKLSGIFFNNKEYGNGERTKRRIYAH